jgi:hypothetical protein
MSKAVTFSIKNIKTLESIDRYCLAKKNISRSKVISSLLDSVSPILDEISDHYQMAQAIDNKLLSLFKTEITTQIQKQHSTVSAEQHCLEIWNNHIRCKTLLSDDISNQSPKSHLRKDTKIGIYEREEIEDTVRQGMEIAPDARLALFIYTRRIVEHENSLAGGISQTLLLKNNTYDNYLFDIQNAKVLNADDLIFFGINDSLKKNKIKHNPKYLCWIPVFYTGLNMGYATVDHKAKVIVVPVLHREDVPESVFTERPKDVVIVNPFE